MVRKDVPSPVQVVQASHAAIESAAHHHNPLQEHPHLVVCGVANEQALLKAVADISTAGTRMHTFYDSDLKAHIASASEPVQGEQRLVFRKYQLLKEKEVQAN